MTDPISSRSPAGRRYNDEASVCTSDPPASPASSASSSRTASSTPADPQPSRAAVDRLVAQTTRSAAGARTDDGACWRERVLATTTCAGAIGGALTATTGVGAILAVTAGAACGAKLADAEAACLEK